MNGSIKRGKRPEDNFTIVSNDIINDLVISAEARLLLIYMISKPDGWVFRPSDLKRQLGTTDSPAGKTKYDRVMQELRDNGYLEYVTLQDDNGKIIGKQWIISQIIPNRLSQNPTVGKTDSRKIKPLSNTEVVSKTERTNKGAYSELIINEYKRLGMPLDNALVASQIDDAANDLSSTLDRKGLPNPYHMSIDDLKAMIAWLQEPAQSWVDFSASTFTSKAIRAKFATRNASPPAPESRYKKLG